MAGPFRRPARRSCRRTRPCARPSRMVRVLPTLETMAAIYRLARDRGPRSPRFTAYLAAARERDGGGLSAYNPMAGPAAAATVEQLLGCDAEEVARSAASELLSRGEVDIALELAVVVA